MLGVQQVDSRAYAHAYLLRTPEDLPKDFLVRAAEDGFRLGVFLPMDQFGGANGLRFPARILLLRENELICATHPSEGIDEVCIPKDQILQLEAGQILLDMWVGLLTRQGSFHWPYAAHNADVVGEFQQRLKDFLFSDVPSGLPPKARVLGVEPSRKVGHAEAEELLPDEKAFLRFCIAAPAEKRSTRKSLSLLKPGQECVVATHRRLLWITDRQNGYAQPYGTIRRSAPLASVSDVRLVRAAGERRVVLALGHSVAWRIPVQERQEEEARLFCSELRKWLR